MRLPPPLVDLLSRRLVMGLIERGIIASDHPETTIQRVAHLLTEDLRVEDEITEEARRLLLDHQEELKGKDVEYHTLLARAKAQLAQRRGYILSTGPGKLSREKLQDATRQILAALLKDPDVEYFVKDEDLRQAIVHYRALFDDLLEVEADTAQELTKVMTNHVRHLPGVERTATFIEGNARDFQPVEREEPEALHPETSLF